MENGEKGESFINKKGSFQLMELNILEESKKRIIFELKGESHSFCNALKEALWKVKGVEVASYRIEHPLVGEPKFLIETKGIEPREALKKAVAELRKRGKEFKKEIKKLK
ncbi:MAG TPA: DNA-directed RNA polymerase subunit L [Candidatus Parcubacteria bacterium]|nr:DNA-directed RNA polymerase subunit L [Candidatus Parcubacteria bacterium]